MIDYMQLQGTTLDPKPPAGQISEISRGVKSVARELNTRHCLSQLNRAQLRPRRPPPAHEATSANHAHRAGCRRVMLCTAKTTTA